MDGTARTKDREVGHEATKPLRGHQSAQLLVILARTRQGTDAEINNQSVTCIISLALLFRDLNF